MLSFLSPYLTAIAFGAGVLAGGSVYGVYDRWIDDPAVARAARAGYVQEDRALAAEAKLAERERQLAAGRKAIDGYADLLKAAQTRQAADAETDRKKEFEYETNLVAAGRACMLDQHDLDFLR